MRASTEARARSRAYSLFARLVGAGPSSKLELEAARAEERMAAAIASYADIDELLSDHQHVFGFSCPPFESALLDPLGVLGNETSLRLRDTLARVGIAEGPGGEEPDHLATELYALALLAAAEADALEDAEGGSVERTREAARHLLDAHLLRWLPTWAAAVRRANRRWPSALAHAVEELVLQHRSQLGLADDRELAFELPPMGVSLEDAGTGLGDIARLLACPARSGMLLARDDIAWLGRSLATPRGFGDRATLLENLLRAGAELGSMGGVLELLEAKMASARDQLAAERLADVPERLRAPWQARLDETRGLITRVRDAYRDVA